MTFTRSIGALAGAAFAAAAMVPQPAAAQALSLYTLFEDACVAPFDLFFGETEGVLRSWGFDIYPTDGWTDFEHRATGISGSYSANPEDLFCQIHDPSADVYRAADLAQVLLQNSYNVDPTREMRDGAAVAYSVPGHQSSCCDVWIFFSDRGPGDIPGGARLTLLMMDR